MGVSYCAVREGIPNYDTNFSGADLLAWVYQWAGLKVQAHPHPRDTPRLPRSATGEEATRAAQVLAQLSDARYAEVAERHQSLFVGGVSELKQIVAEWIVFLLASNGYQEQL